MKILVILALLIGIYGCDKRTTPRKVEKKLTTGAWLINDFVDGDSSLIDYYNNLRLRFGKEGSVSATFKSQVDGEFAIGTDRNPATIYIDFPATDSLHVLSDDWAVVLLSDDKVILKRKVGKTGEKDEFDYEKETDNLTFYKFK